MKKLGLCLCLICVVSLLGACGPSFKNIREADSYIEKERASADEKVKVYIRPPSILQGVHFFMNPVLAIADRGRKSAKALGGGYDAPVPYKRQAITNPYGRIDGSINFKRREVVYQAEPGKPPRNIINEAFIKAGEIPSCAVTGINKILWHSSTSEGDDWQVVTAKCFEIEMHYAGLKDSETPCNWKIAYDHLHKVIYDLADTLVSRRLN